MLGQSQPRVAVLGMTESGRGWATLLAGAGWPVTIYDPDAAVLHSGEEEIATRRRHSAGSGIPAIRDDREEHTPGEPRLGRSLLDAVTNADWMQRSRSLADGALRPSETTHPAGGGSCPGSGGARSGG
jgi:3-hydroxyacyl-CoA dehydrogenase